MQKTFLFLLHGGAKTRLLDKFRTVSTFLLLVGAKLLYVDSVLHLEALQNRGLVELLTSAELLDNTSLFELSLELFEGLLDVLAFFYWYNNHCLCF